MPASGRGARASARPRPRRVNIGATTGNAPSRATVAGRSRRPGGLAPAVGAGRSDSKHSARTRLRGEALVKRFTRQIRTGP